MNRQEKTKYLSDFSEEIKNVSGLVLTNYQGLNMYELSALRKELRPLGCKYMVVKNKMSKLVFENNNLQPLIKDLEGPTAVLFIKGEPLPAIKGIVKFAKEHEKLVIKSGYIYNKFLSSQEIDDLSKLPSKEVVLYNLIGILQLPLMKLLYVLNLPIMELVNTINQIKNKREGTKE